MSLYHSLRIQMDPALVEDLVAALRAAGLPYSEIQVLTRNSRSKVIIGSITAFTLSFPWASVEHVLIAWLQARADSTVTFSLPNGGSVSAKGQEGIAALSRLKGTEDLVITLTTPTPPDESAPPSCSVRFPPSE